MTENPSSSHARKQSTPLYRVQPKLLTTEQSIADSDMGQLAESHSTAPRLTLRNQ